MTTMMWLLLLTITTLSSNAFSQAAARTLSLSQPQIERDALPNNASNVLDLSQLNANLTSFNDTQFLCSGEEYGWDLSLRSCLDALEHGVGHDTHPISFGHREDPGVFHMRLPARVTGCTAPLPFSLKLALPIFSFSFTFTVFATGDQRLTEQMKWTAAPPTPSRSTKMSSTSGLCRRRTTPE